MRLTIQVLALALALISVSVAKTAAAEKEDYGTVIGIDLGTTYSW